jgi:hypothetical protein
MATFSITTEPRHDDATQALTARHNAMTGESLTPLEYARLRILELFDRWADRYEEDMRTTKATLYQRATPEDQASIDAILDKYR